MNYIDYPVAVAQRIRIVGLRYLNRRGKMDSTSDVHKITLVRTHYYFVAIHRPLNCCTKLSTLESNRLEYILEEFTGVKGLSKVSVYKRWTLDFKNTVTTTRSSSMECIR